MTVAGIIMECNPFHSGHQYIIDEARRLTNADYVVVVLSGDYVQRGIPAIVSKERRTADVLNAGADLVLALPLTYSTASAEYFARGAVRILCSLGVVNDVVFGAANADKGNLLKMARILADESPNYQKALKSALKTGVTYPVARSMAAAEVLGIELPQNGNDILGIEYIRALDLYNPEDTITVHPVQRVDVESATRQRARMLTARSQNRTNPGEAYLEVNDFSEQLYYRLQEVIGLHGCSAGIDASEDKAAEILTTFLDIDNDLARRIINELPSYHDWNSFVMTIKTRNYTYARVSRALMHILLDVRRSDVEMLDTYPTCGYARILGFRKSAGPLMSAIKAQGSVPLITSIRSAVDDPTIPPIWRGQLLRDCKASELYDHAAMLQCKGNAPISEFTKQPIMI